MKTLIFETSLTGHRLEYIHHIYMGSCKRPNEHYVFVLPYNFIQEKQNLEWPESENIKIVLMTKEEVNKTIQGSNIWKKWIQYCLLRKYIKIEKPERIFLVMLMNIVPFLFLPLSSDVKICGIIYRVYLYEKSVMPKILLFINKIVYRLLAKQKKFEKLYILNDFNSAREFNLLNQTNKFNYVADPVPCIDKKYMKDIRKQLNVGIDDTVYLQFGGLDARKGTLKILQALCEMDENLLDKKVFVFAGKLSDGIREEFLLLVKQLSEKVRIVIYEGFCSYEFLNNLCYSCDALLIPYSNTSQSSGVIGYAAFFEKPVIGPKEGLLGSLISNYNMGISLEDSTPSEIVKALLGKLPKVNNSYTSSHTIDEFVNTILN